MQEERYTAMGLPQVEAFDDEDVRTIDLDPSIRDHVR
jgi:hypothetical protein